MLVETAVALHRVLRNVLHCGRGDCQTAQGRAIRIGVICLIILQDPKNYITEVERLNDKIVESGNSK